jgi:hypothetical protein
MKYIAKGILEHDNAKRTLQHDNANATQIYIGNHTNVSFLFFPFLFIHMIHHLPTSQHKTIGVGSKHGQVYGKVLQYTKTIMFLVKRLKVVAKCYLNWIFFHATLSFCVKYSNTKHLYEIFEIDH